MQAQTRRLRDGQSILDTVRRSGPAASNSALGSRDREKARRVSSPASASWSSGMATSEQWLLKRPKPAKARRQAAARHSELRPTWVGKTRLMFDLIHLALQNRFHPRHHAPAAGHEPRAPVPGVVDGCHHDPVVTTGGQDPKDRAASPDRNRKAENRAATCWPEAREPPRSKAETLLDRHGRLLQQQPGQRRQPLDE